MMEKFITASLVLFAGSFIAVLMAFSFERDETTEIEKLITENDETSFAVVELFTSEGCSSCPPADELLSRLVDRARSENQPIYALAFHVDYWDYLGWEDAYSSSYFSQRQRNYADALHSNRIYTPQMIVNGEHEFVGSDRRQAERYIQKTLKEPATLNIDLESKFSEEGWTEITYRIDTIPSESVINYALVERGIVRHIERGENRGRTLHHDNVVRSFHTEKLTEKEGKTVLQIPVDLVVENASIIVYVQRQREMKVLGAEKVSLSSGSN